MTVQEVIAQAERDRAQAIERVSAHATDMRREFVASRAFEARMSAPSRTPVPGVIRCEREFQAGTAVAIAGTHERIRRINADYDAMIADFGTADDFATTTCSGCGWTCAAHPSGKCALCQIPAASRRIAR